MSYHWTLAAEGGKTLNSTAMNSHLQLSSPNMTRIIEVPGYRLKFNQIYAYWYQIMSVRVKYDVVSMSTQKASHVPREVHMPVRLFKHQRSR